MNARRFQWLVVAVLGAVVVWGVIGARDTGDPALRVAERLACPVCDGESVAASQTDVARDMLERIRVMQAEGASDAEVVAWFVARFGPEVDLQPPLDVGGLLLRSVPVVVLAVGAAVVWRLRTMSRRGGDGAAVPAEAGDDPLPRLQRRTLVGLGVVAVVLVAASFAVGQFLQPRAPGSPVTGDITAPVDLDAISDETLADTIAAFAGDPDVPAAQLNGMRLALAERYFEAGNYRDASTVFRDVLDNDPLPAQASEAFGRLGWILWVNDEPAAAETAFRRAIDLFDGNGEARYLFALMLVESDRPGDAVPLLEALVDDPSVPAELTDDIAAMLAEAKGGT